MALEPRPPSPPPSPTPSTSDWEPYKGLTVNQREPELPTPWRPKAAPQNHGSGSSLGEQLVRPFFLQKRKLRTEKGATRPGANGRLPLALAV